MLSGNDFINATLQASRRELATFVGRSLQDLATA
jgi:hypothetical protein